MRVEILPIFTNLHQEIPDSSVHETYPVYIWLDLKQGEVWAEADKEALVYKSPHIYAWKIPLMSDSNTMELMKALRDKIALVMDNHIKEFPSPPYTVKNHRQWKLNATGTQAMCGIDRYLKLFCGYVNK